MSSSWRRSSIEREHEPAEQARAELLLWLGHAARRFLHRDDVVGSVILCLHGLLEADASIIGLVYGCIDWSLLPGIALQCRCGSSRCALSGSSWDAPAYDAGIVCCNAAGARLVSGREPHAVLSDLGRCWNHDGDCALRSSLRFGSDLVSPASRPCPDHLDLHCWLR